jgi:hypothetical protein
MSNVRRLELVKRNADETIRLLRYALQEAEGGRLWGGAMCFNFGGREVSYFTDCYRADHTAATRAALRMSIDLMQGDPPI